MAATAYIEFAKRAFNRESVYRVQVFTRIGSILLRVFLMATLWTALYRTNGEQAGITLHGMITYVTLALVIGLIYNVDGAYVIREKIREGSIAIDLMRPISAALRLFRRRADAVLSSRSWLCCLASDRRLDPPSSPVVQLRFYRSRGVGSNYLRPHHMTTRSE